MSARYPNTGWCCAALGRDGEGDGDGGRNRRNQKRGNKGFGKKREGRREAEERLHVMKEREEQSRRWRAAPIREIRDGTFIH